MSVAKVVAIGAAAVLVHLALVMVLPTRERVQKGPREVPEAVFNPLEDDHDRGVYLQRGSWLPRGQVPYLEVHSEYPELATWFCAVPYLFLDAPSEPRAYKGLPPLGLETAYLNFHSAEMAACLILLILVTALLARELGNDPRRGLFLLLPGTMYFALSRYDVLPALLISLALLLLIRRRHLLATFVLSLAILAKWYPILFLPFFLNYTRRVLDRPILPPLVLSAATAAAVLGTTFVSCGLRYQEMDGRPAQLAAVEAQPLPAKAADPIARAPEAWQPFLTGGLRGLLSPYLYQGKRITNPGGIYFQMQQRWFDIEPGSAREAWILKALTLLQFVVLVFGFVVPMRGPHQLVRWMLLGTLFFVLFAKFYSPQWVIWTTALAAPFMRSRWLIGGIVALEVLIYLQLGILRWTPVKGDTLPDGTASFTDAWFHLYDARMAITACITLLVIGSIARLAPEKRNDPSLAEA